MEYIKWKSRSDWERIRSGGIGGSDAAAIMGFSPFRTPYMVWEEKCKHVEHVPENQETLDFGTFAEEFIAGQYKKQTGLIPRRYNFTAKDGCLLGNVDRLINTSGNITNYRSEVRADKLLEIKTTIDYEWKEVPLHYQAQVQHYLGLFPMLKSADVAVLYKPTGKVQIFPVERDAESIENMQEYLREWWDKHIIHGVAPAPINEADCKRIWRESKRGKTIEANQAILETALCLWELRRDKKDLEREEQGLKDQIACYMEDAEELVNPETGKTILRYAKQSGRVDTRWADVAEELSKRLGMTFAEFSEFKANFQNHREGIRPMTFLRSIDQED